MDTVKLFQMAVRPKVSHLFFTVDNVVEDDAPEQLDQLSRDLDSISGLAILVEYAAESGELTQRVVSCRKINEGGGVRYLSAFCHYRNALRSFRVDRIRAIFDPRTGEALGPVDEYLSQFEIDHIAKSGLSWGLSPTLRMDLLALLNALVFMARCDNEYHPLERGALEAILARFWLRLEISGDPDFDDILRYVDRLAPDGEVFWLSLSRIKQQSVLLPMFKNGLREVIDADGYLHEREFYWVQQVEEFLG